MRTLVIVFGVLVIPAMTAADVLPPNVPSIATATQMERVLLAIDKVENFSLRVKQHEFWFAYQSYGLSMSELGALPFPEGTKEHLLGLVKAMRGIAVVSQNRPEQARPASQRIGGCPRFPARPVLCTAREQAAADPQGVQRDQSLLELRCGSSRTGQDHAVDGKARQDYQRLVCWSGRRFFHSAF